MKVYIFGSNGMLGRYTSTFLEDQEYDVVRLTRKDYDISELTYESLKTFLDNKKLNKDDIIINCAGIITQRKGNSTEIYYKVNSYFPRYLALWKKDYYPWSEQQQPQVIHASTDCVFSGKRGSYNEKDVMDADDLYGFSKAMGETPGINVVRSSIIGEEIENKVSFFEFVRKNAGGEINGFQNQIWNGITCLQWAKNVEQVFRTYPPSVYHFPSEVFTKDKVAELVSDVYDLNVKVNPIDAPKSFDKTLTTIYYNIRRISLRTQLEEMKEFTLR